MSGLISIIMPVYNAEAFVTEAIESVLAQTYPHWELIIVDDGSTDASPEVLKRYTNPRIVMIRQQNKGEGGARNTGLERARGEYIGFLDADDVYLPTALADFVDYLRQHDKVDVAHADGYYCDDALRPLRRLSECRPGTHEGMILEPLLLTPLVVSPPLCMLVRKTAVEAGHVRFDESLRYGVDWDFWIQLARQARYGNLPKLIGLYRLHPNSMTRGTTQRALNEKLVPGRLKVMNAPWFEAVSLQTRSEFFYNLLLGLLGDQPEQQQTIIDAAPFLALPAGTQADLLRLVASHHLSNRRDIAFALDCLRRSLNLQPGSAKGRMLLLLGSRSPTLAATSLSIWQIAHQAAVGVRTFGRRKSKPVPGVRSLNSTHGTATLLTASVRAAAASRLRQGQEMIQVVREGPDRSFVRRLRWIAYRRLPKVLGALARRLRPRFADVEGANVLWFGLHCVERREGGGYVAVGDNSRIEGTLICHRTTSRLLIGSRTSIGGAALIESLGQVIIGNDCLISYHVTIQDHNSHPIQWEYRQNDVLNWIAGLKDWTHIEQADVVIGDRCWIGTRCIILKGVNLGEGTIVGAGSVVTKSFPPYSIIAGNPARLIRSQVEPNTADRAISA